MAAPFGSKNAEVWTITESQKFIDSVFTYVLEHKDCCSIEEACCELGEYEKVLNYLENKFKDNQDVNFNAIKKAKGILKNRILKQGLNNKYNPTMAIFVLKNNHDMKDKSEVDTTLNAQIIWNESHD